MADLEAPQVDRLGAGRGTRFDPGADGGGDGDEMQDSLLQSGQHEQQESGDYDNEFEEVVGYEHIRVSMALPTLVEWLAARGVAPEEQERMRKVTGGTFMPGAAWDREGFATYLPVGEPSELEDDSGVQRKRKPPARVENWYRLHERVLREHFWEMKHNSAAGKWDREVGLSDMIAEARDNHLNASELPVPWLDADRHYLNVLPDQVRREGWLRNPPRKGATASDVEQWPKGGLILVRRSPTGAPMHTVLSSEGVSSTSWWKPIFGIPRPLGGQQSTGEALLRLDVEVLSLHFRDHQLYTEEDRVARVLSELYKTYTMKNAEGKIEHLQRKVDAIKIALGEAAPDGETAKSYRKELREVRDLMDQEHSEQKQRERQLRVVWNKLKHLRREQRFNGAAIKMKWRNKKVDQQAEEQALEMEITERLAELRAEYDSKVGEFNLRIEKLEAIKQEKMEKRTLAASTNDSAKEQRYASAIKKLDSRLKQLRRSTPEAKGFDETAKRTELMDTYKAVHMRMPGEPHLVPVILQDPVDDLKDTNEEEKERRARVKATSFYVKLELDGTVLKHHSPTLAMPSSAESSIDFAHRFQIMVAAPPESLYIHLYEVGKSLSSGKTLISKIPIQVPGAGSILPQRISQHSNVAFSGGEPFETIVTRMDEDGKPKKEPATHFVDGDLSVRVTWDTTAANSLVNDKPVAGQSALESLLPTSSMVDPNDPTGGMAGAGSLPVIGNAPFDPNNPLDLPVIGGTRDIVMEEGTALDDPTDRNTYFRLDKDDSDINFIVPNPEEERRNKLLQLRFSGKSDPALQQMPFTGEDITPDMMEGATDEDILDFRKAKKKKTLTAGQLKKIELQKRAGAAMPSERTREVRTEEMVKEEELPEFKLSFDWLFALLAPRNPLRPQLIDRKSQRGITEATIVIQVVSASNIPCRLNPNADPNDEDECSPFVEVQFGRHEKATPMLQGTQAQWNHVIELPYASATGDLTTEKGEVEFNLFDREVTREASSGSGISERHQKRWLASFNLPFQTIFREKTVNGTVPMQLPLINMGYRIPEPAQSVTLSFYATLEPTILPPEMDEDQRPSSEDDVLRVYAQKWLDDVQKRPECVDRNICVLAPSSSGESVFVTRYIHPQNPPPTCDNDDSIARYVSLIPFANDEDDEGQRDDIWFTSHEFLQMQQGDWEEHAILLCNFFLSKGKQAYVCLGTAMPDGDAAFVLTKEEFRGRQTWYCWNPTTAQKFVHTAPDCPLKDIGMVFDKENVWANIQHKSSNIQFTSFEFENPKCWRRFDLNIETPSTCQKDDNGNTDITYYNPNMKTVWDDSKESADERKKFMMAVEKDVKSKLEPLFEEWRADAVGANVPWNKAGDVVRSMRKTLETCEREKRGEIKAHRNGTHFLAADGHSQGESRTKDLDEMQEKYIVHGFPINDCITGLTEKGTLLDRGIDKIAQTLNCTDSHENQHEDVQFSLAVKAHLYPNKIISVWVLCVSMVKR